MNAQLPIAGTEPVSPLVDFWNQVLAPKFVRYQHMLIGGLSNQSTAIIPKPGENAHTCGPGPFSMADEQVTRAQMQSAGLAEINFERIDAKVLVGRNIKGAIDFQLAIGPAGETFREAGVLGEERRPEREAALAEMFEGSETTADGLWMESSSWLITARNPADA